MIIFIRCDVSGDGDLDNVFLDLFELKEGTDATSIYNSLKGSLRESGFNDVFFTT